MYTNRLIVIRIAVIGNIMGKGGAALRNIERTTDADIGQ